MDMLLQIQDKYFGHRIKRYILGQTLTTEADATGLGSGVADAHKDTLAQIVRYDALNLEESLTHELVRIIQILNFPETEGWQMELKFELESEDAKAKMDSYQTA
jgi:phage gp29-like protein